MPLKRNNWTNEEIIGILESHKASCMGRQELLSKEEVYSNNVLDDIIGLFHDFNRAPDEYGAMSCETSDFSIWVTGPKLPR